MSIAYNVICTCLLRLTRWCIVPAHDIQIGVTLFWLVLRIMRITNIILRLLCRITVLCGGTCSTSGGIIITRVGWVPVPSFICDLLFAFFCSYGYTPRNVERVFSLCGSSLCDKLFFSLRFCRRNSSLIIRPVIPFFGNDVGS